MWGVSRCSSWGPKSRCYVIYRELHRSGTAPLSRGRTSLSISFDQCPVCPTLPTHLSSWKLQTNPASHLQCTHTYPQLQTTFSSISKLLSTSPLATPLDPLDPLWPGFLHRHLLSPAHRSSSNAPAASASASAPCLLAALAARAPRSGARPWARQHVKSKRRAWRWMSSVLWCFCCVLWVLTLYRSCWLAVWNHSDLLLTFDWYRISYSWAHRFAVICGSMGVDHCF